MDIFVQIIFTVTLILIIVLLYLQFKQIKKYDKLTLQNISFLESIEKYIEIFNEQNVNELLKKEKLIDNSVASAKIESIREDYRKKLISKNQTLSEDHEMLIDFITLTLSLIIKTPPTLREKIIDENTDNAVIKKILKSKLPSIEEHYLPVSLLEIAISSKKS